MRSKKERTTLSIVLLAMAMMLAASYVFAAPTGVSIAATSSARSGASTGAGTVYAEAGNMTLLEINGSAASQSWQGYYGNISGNFTLASGTGADAGTLYNWPLGSVSGEIYSSRHSGISFDPVACSNATLIAAEENTLNMEPGSGENISDTFSTSNHHPTFSVGSNSITDAATCFTALTYSNNATQSGTDVYFPEIMLNDESHQVYWAVIINSSGTGFNGKEWDFQMLLPEDGHGAAADTRTQMYFWAELS